MRAFVLALVIVLSGCAAAAHEPHAPAAASAPAITVTGLSGAPVALTRADLAALPRQAVRLESHGQSTLYEGPLLMDVLARVGGAPSGAALRGEAMALAALITARDGYQVAFTLAELDPAFAGTVAILADSADGTEISDENGPFRIVVEGDRRAARSARMVARIEIVRPRP